jgi:proline racemase
LDTKARSVIVFLSELMTRYKTINAHVAGEAVRLIVEGAPTIKGRSMEDKLAWLRKHAEPLRSALMLEPRGHAGMHGALFTEPVLPKAHAGLLFMNAGGFPPVSGEGVMAAVAIAIEQKIIHVNADALYVDTPAGLLTAHPHCAGGENATAVSGVALTGLPGFVQAAGLPVQLRGRTVPVDVAFGGELYAIADGEAVGVPVDAEHAPELIRTAARLQEAVDEALRVRHPGLSAINGVIFTAPARQGGHLRSATVLNGGVLRRSPGATGTVALMAVLDAMGILDDDQEFIHEGVLGTILKGRVVRRQTVEEISLIFPRIEGAVSLTGHHEFVVNKDSPAFRI